MADDQKIGTEGSDGIEFKAPEANQFALPSDVATAAAVSVAPAAVEPTANAKPSVPGPPQPPVSLAEEVGLQIGPNPNTIHDDIQRMLREVALPPEREPENFPGGAVTAVPPAAPPVGVITAQMPVIPEAIAAAEEPVEVEVKTKDPVVSLHTMKDDLQEAVRSQQITTVRAAAMAADKRAEEAPKDEKLPEIARPRIKRVVNRRMVLLVAMILVFMALGAAALFAAFVVTQKQSSAPAQTTNILFAEQQTALPMGTQGIAGIKQTLSNMLASQSGGAGSILKITPIILGASGQPSRKATLEEFLRSMGAKPPEDFLRAVSSDFFVGIHAADTPSPVFVIPVTSYDHAFAGMLTWEPSLDQDLGALFRQVNPYVTTSASTTPQVRAFQDAVMRNYDVRVLRDDSGGVVLYYSFPTPNILIIASSPYTFPEVLSRLQAERKL
jgi:hypothetical protein